MKEININIEGYNVNGICVGCLNYGRKMFYRDEVKECFRYLADIDVPDGLTIQVCWECLANVRTVNRFQAQVLRSYDVLIEYSQKHTFLNSPADLSQYAYQRLSAFHISKTEPTSLVDDDDKTEELEVKVELEDDKFEIEFEEKPLIKAEGDDNQDSQYSDQEVSQGVTSDEDIQLSQLKKKKKEKKSKRVKKEGRKSKTKEDVPIKEESKARLLKNFPEHLVEPYTMTEEEMWQIRTKDLASAEFAKLKYKCKNCIIGFNTEKLMKDHFNGKHKPKSPDCQQCDVCLAYFLTKDNLSAHRSLHLRALRCRACALVSALRRHMRAHAAAHRDHAYKCSHCQAEFTTKSKLSYHRNICHQEKPQCDCCGKVFANKMTLKYHLKILPQNRVDKPKEKLFIPCKGCSKVFTSKKSYRAHVVIHDGLTYPCPICGKLFQWKRNLARHTRNHRERAAGALHECRECGKTFSSRDCYNNHMRLSKRHVPDEKYGHECNYCGKKFATKWCMVDHIDWDHLKRIKYQCSVCFKAFKTAKIMVAHMNNIHEGKKSKEPEGEHLCEICGKSYKTVKRLKGHVWAMHTKRSTTKSFKCKLCPATFTWQTSIYKHIKMMHATDKRNKAPRSAPVKKLERYPSPELSRMQYFPQNMLPPPQMPLHHDIM